ncbi:oocyte zinc finger protein XlCOF8.4-like [Hyla sarda]|uniref:oocyte zinc finger protein XlCOF8.4-like n=1 Tax=Hyla sarda TaxID=327740 RepID=UPI0024C39F40|nr:oocyte zinc finger protein XlCOF8.4-like [Hyla sarda]
MEEWEYIEGHKDLYQDIVMMGDHRPPTSPLDIDPTRMEKARKHMAARILHLTLEIIHLITGEDYTVVKKWSGECVTPRVSGGSGTTQSPTPEEPPPHSLIHEQKILELTTRMTELMTGEVPIRCQDVTVYFSMEEWEYIEGHKDLYQDIVMMGDHRPPTSQDGHTGDEVMDRNPPERCPRPLYSQDCPEGNVPEKHQGGDLTNNEVEEEEERMSGHHPCMREVKEEIPGGVTPENPINDANGNFILLLNPKVKVEDIMQHSPGDDFLPLTVYPGPHSTDLSYNAPNHGEPSPDPSQVVTTRTDQREGKMFHCGECKKEFKTNLDLITHRRSHTEEKYSCSLCGKCFTGKKELLSHERMHIAENPYSCSKCGERFTKKTDLVIHQETHTGKMTYICPECGKFCNSKSNLVRHFRTHTGEKPYSCSECGKRFSTKDYVIVHQKIHTAEKPYSCSECGKRLKTNATLSKHMQNHTGEKPHSCSECGKCFAYKSLLDKHKRTHT